MFMAASRGASTKEHCRIEREESSSKVKDGLTWYQSVCWKTTEKSITKSSIRGIGVCIGTLDVYGVGKERTQMYF